MKPFAVSLYDGGKPPKSVKMLYALLEPGYGKVRYVGVSADPFKRYREHCASIFTHDSPVSDWLYDLIINKHQFPCLDVWPDWREDWPVAEARLINEYRSVGADLLNRLWKGSKISDSHKRNISAGHKLSWENPSSAQIEARKRLQAGTPCSDEVREKISKARSGTKLSPEHRAAISKGLMKHYRGV